jgi:hypothetical protein
MNDQASRNRDWVVRPDGAGSSQDFDYVYHAWCAINYRIAVETLGPERAATPIIPDQAIGDLTLRMREIERLDERFVYIEDIYGNTYLLDILKSVDNYTVSAERTSLTVRSGVMDEPGEMVHATHHTLVGIPGSRILRAVEGSSTDAFRIGLTLVNDLIDESNSPPESLTHFIRSGRHLAFVEVGTFSYVAGLLGAAAFMALSIGPGILGFLVVYLPASGLSVWAASGHE